MRWACDRTIELQKYAGIQGGLGFGFGLGLTNRKLIDLVGDTLNIRRASKKESKFMYKSLKACHILRLSAVDLRPLSLPLCPFRTFNVAPSPTVLCSTYLSVLFAWVLLQIAAGQLNKMSFRTFQIVSMRAM